MSDYTTITIPQSLKEELSEGMADHETWNEYLHRLRTDSSDPPTADRATQLSEEDLIRLRETVHAVANELPVDEEAPGQPAATSIDYDHLREIVREEVRRALEDVVH